MSARLSGLNGAVYMGATPTIVADVYEWTFEPKEDLLPCDIKSDRYHRFVPDAGGAVFRAKRRIESTAFFSGLVIDAIANETQALFRLDLIDNNGSYTQIQGQGYVTSGTLGVPYNGPADDMIELTFDGVWTQT